MKTTTKTIKILDEDVQIYHFPQDLYPVWVFDQQSGLSAAGRDIIDAVMTLQVRKYLQNCY